MLSIKKIIPVLVTAFIIAIECSLSFNSVLLPNLQESFHISDQLASYSISLGLFCLGVAAIIYGGLCDGLGRRPIILLSSFLFCCGTLFSALAPSIEILLISRFAQGLGAGAGWVIGNASLRDVFHERLYIKVINYVHSVVGIIPAVAPVLGSYLTKFLEWRDIFMGLFLFAFLVFIVQIFWLPETLLQRKKITRHLFFRNFLAVFQNRQYQYYVLIKVTAVMILFMDIATSPLMLVKYMGIPEPAYGYYIFPLFAFYVLMTLATEKIFLKYFSADTVLKSALGMILIGNALTLVVGQIDMLSAEMIQGFKILTYMGFGMIFGTATGCLVDAVHERAGSGAALMIALEMLASSIGISLLSLFFEGGYEAYSWGVFGVVIFVLGSTFFAKKTGYVRL